MERSRLELVSQVSKKEQAKKNEEAPKLGSMKEYLMRLKELCPNLSEADLENFRHAKPLFKGLSPEKRVHARNVSLRVARMFPESEVILGALLHDTKEQIPKEYAAMENQLPQITAEFVRLLSEDPRHSNEQENAPLAHLKAIFPTLSPEMKNRLILIKLADRLDNLTKRLQKDGVSKSYREKSEQLVSFLVSEFQSSSEDPLNELQLRQVKNELLGLLVSHKQQKDSLQKAA